MKKLKLRIDDLSVVSFETRDAERKGEGTVHGHDETIQCSAQTTCCWTQWDSCAGELSCNCGTGGPTQCPTE